MCVNICMSSGVFNGYSLSVFVHVCEFTHSSPTISHRSCDDWQLSHCSDAALCSDDWRLQTGRAPCGGNQNKRWQPRRKVAPAAFYEEKHKLDRPPCFIKNKLLSLHQQFSEEIIVFSTSFTKCHQKEHISLFYEVSHLHKGEYFVQNKQHIMIYRALKVAKLQFCLSLKEKETSRSH